MAKLPDLTLDPTLKKLDAELERVFNKKNARREYLGMSGIGHPCWRKSWYNFRWCNTPYFAKPGIAAIEDGFHGEDVQAYRLNLVPEVTLLTIDDRTGEQFGYEDIGGHFRGHMDGVISGLLQAPKTTHVWEHKQVNQKKFDKLNKLKQDVGEKKAFEQWDTTYYVQGVLYMHYSGLTRHYLTVASPGGRDTTSCRTNPDKKRAKKEIEKARTIIFSEAPVAERISESETWFECKWCDAIDVCHRNKVPEPNCRNCLNSTPTEDGKWICERYDYELSKEEQLAGCLKHLFIPPLISYAQQGRYTEDEDGKIAAIEYIMEQGTFWNVVDAGAVVDIEGETIKVERCFSSKELSALHHSMIFDKNIMELRRDMGAKVEVANNA